MRRRSVSGSRHRGGSFVLRSLGLVVGFLVLTGQASTQGCMAEEDSAPPASQGSATVETPAGGNGAAAGVAAPAAGGPVLGKYGCTESIPRFRGGAYEYEIETRGFLQLQEGGRYTDPMGVAGRYRHDPLSEETHFEGGALHRAVATPLEADYPRLWVVIPTESGERRWACGRVEG